MPVTTGHDLIFGHAGEPRVAASVTLIVMVAMLIGAAFMAIGAPGKQGSGPARGSIGAAPAAVRVIGAAPREDGPCDQQVWPNIAQRCLVRTQAKTDPARTEAKTSATPLATQENSKLSPLTAAVVDHHASLQDDATSGSGVQEDTAVLRYDDAINAQAPPDATVAAANGDVDELPSERAMEAPRKRGHRQHGFTFHLHFGGFHF